MLTWTLLVGLATYRLWRMIARDKILDRPRDWFFDKANGDTPVRLWFVEMIDCVWCLGFWIAGGLAATVALSSGRSTMEGLLLWLASATVAGLVRQLDHGAR